MLVWSLNPSEHFPRTMATHITGENCALQTLIFFFIAVLNYYLNLLLLFNFMCQYLFFFFGPKLTFYGKNWVLQKKLFGTPLGLWCPINIY